MPITAINLLVVAFMCLCVAALYFLGYSQGFRGGSARASRLVCKSPDLEPGTKATLSTEILSGDDQEGQ